MAIGQCRSGGITVATVAPAHGAEDVVPDNEISGGPPFDMGLTMSAPKKIHNRHVTWHKYLLYSPLCGFFHAFLFAQGTV